MDNQVKVFLLLPRKATRSRLLPRNPNHTYFSRGIKTIQSFLKLNHATSYISRVSWIRPYVSRGIKTIPSQLLPRKQNHTISTSPEGTKPYHLDFSRVWKSYRLDISRVWKPYHLDISRVWKPYHIDISRLSKPNNIDISQSRRWTIDANIMIIIRW